MGRLTPEDAEVTAQMFEDLFTELAALREIVHENFGEALQPVRVNVAAVRVMILNLMDVATEQDLKGTPLSELPVPGIEDYEWLPTTDLVKAMNTAMSALVRDLAVLRPLGGGLGRELDVHRLRMAWTTLEDRQIENPGATIRVTDDADGDVGLKVLFEPPMANPFKKETMEDDLTPAQIIVGNMMAYAFKERNAE